MKRLLVIACLSLTLAFLPNAGRAQEGTSFVLGLNTPVVTFNGLLSGPSQQGTFYLIPLFQEPLFSWAQGQINPLLATSWSAVDGATYTISLSQTVAWQDGAPFSAWDVAFTYQRALDPGLGSPFAESLRKVIADPSTPVNVIDDDTIQIVSNGGDQTAFLRAITIPILPKHIWESISSDQWAADPGSTGSDPSRVVGTGPFTFQWMSSAIDCGKQADPNAPVDNPDADIAFVQNPSYTGASNLSQFFEYHLFIYACDRNGVNPTVRTGMAKDSGIIGGIPALNTDDGGNVSPVIVVDRDAVIQLPSDVAVLDTSTDQTAVDISGGITVTSPDLTITTTDSIEVNVNLMDQWIDVEQQ